MVVDNFIVGVWIIVGAPGDTPQIPSMWKMLRKGPHCLEAVQNLASSTSHSA